MIAGTVSFITSTSTESHCPQNHHCTRHVIRSAQKLQRLIEMKLIVYTDLWSSHRKLTPLHTAWSKSWRNCLLAVQVRKKKELQRDARAGQSRSEVKLALTETTCSQWRAGCFNLVVRIGEASGRLALSSKIQLHLIVCLWIMAPHSRAAKKNKSHVPCGATTRYYTSHTKTMLLMRKSLPRSSTQ